MTLGYHSFFPMPAFDAISTELQVGVSYVFWCIVVWSFRGSRIAKEDMALPFAPLSIPPRPQPSHPLPPTPPLPLTPAQIRKAAAGGTGAAAGGDALQPSADSETHTVIREMLRIEVRAGR